jgi:hypothetical protein
VGALQFQGGSVKHEKAQEQAPAERQDKKPDDAEFERFEDLTRKLLEVSKRELEA